MSLECSECERDLRGGHAADCSRNKTRKRIVGCLGDHGVILPVAALDDLTAAIDAMISEAWES